MAKLPPKFPASMASPVPVPPAWHQIPRPPTMSSFFPSSDNPPPETASRPSWVDDFLDFSSAKRGAHRRVVSDSAAFLESVIVADDAAPARSAASSSADFDRLDDEQLMSMFSDEAAPDSALPSTTPSTPSDHNSVSDQDKHAPPPRGGCDQSEAQSKCNAEQQQQVAGTASAPSPAPEISQPIVDPKRVKRILANRQSAQRSRIRKLQYISELERSVTSLQTEVSALSPRVAFLDHQRSVLSAGNGHLKQRIAALLQDKIFKDAHQEALQNEIERLRQVYNLQSLKKRAAVADAFAIDKKELNVPVGADHDPSSES